MLAFSLRRLDDAFELVRHVFDAGAVLFDSAANAGEDVRILVSDVVDLGRGFFDFVEFGNLIRPRLVGAIGAAGDEVRLSLP